MKATAEQPLSATLYYKAGSSDKVYQVQLEAQEGGWIVRFAYGRRGGPLRPGAKTASPVTYEKAAGIYGKLVAEKAAEGYVEGAAGAAMVEAGGVVLASAAEGFVPLQLMAEASEAEAEMMLDSDEWVMQEKHDGERLQLHRDGDRVFGFSKLGRLRTVLPEPVVAAALKVRPWSRFILDGELVGDRLRVFDVLSYGPAQGRPDDDVRGSSYQTRYRAYNSFVGSTFHSGLTVVPAVAGALKRPALAAIRAARGEGVVFKRALATYRAGRNIEDAAKYKFVATASVIVLRHNRKGKRSFDMGLAGGLGIGSCTVPVNQELPPVAACVEVQYLYAVGKLVQAVYLGVRTDILPEECVVGQLKYRQEPAL